MGGRGASSGVSKKGNPYGSQYHTVLQVGNVKFVEAKTDKQPETLVEAMTPGRTYVLVNNKNGNLKSIIFNGEDGKRYKRIDLDHYHLKAKPHAHDGYLEGVFRKSLDSNEIKQVEEVYRAWDNFKRKS